VNELVKLTLTASYQNDGQSENSSFTCNVTIETAEWAKQQMYKTMKEVLKVRHAEEAYKHEHGT